MLAHNAAHPSDLIVKTCDIATKIVRGETSSLPKGHQAYVQLAGGRHRGTPTYFVSHTWIAPAIALLESVLVHGHGIVAGGGERPVYYLDVASVDQHETDQVST